MDEPEPHPTYYFFAPGPLPGYAGNPNNANRLIEADVPLLGEMGEPLGAEVDEPMVDPVIDEVAEPIAEGEEQVIAPVIDLEEDIAMLFSNDDSEGFEDDEEVGGPSTATAEGHSLALPAPGFLVPPSVIEDLSTRMGNLEYGHG
ncbi:hypothetical protein Tco_0729713 [Tanacetum coccineum]|uniref:Uncharacterized protein n=1 Tax=Tanacetum coccineum TaxID=301880 RepID=A0ABQ4YQK5_9ASTR